MCKLKFFLILCLVIGALVSCSEKEDEPEPASAAEQDYLPTTTGTSWTYGGMSPYTLTVTGNMKVINGKSYHEMEQKTTSASYKSYVLKENGVYTAIGMVPGSGMDELEITNLKEEAPIGISWEQTNTINYVDTKMSCMIMEKGASKTVQGKTFKDVINVKMVTTFTFMGQEVIPAVTTHYYFSKGVGLILTDAGAMGQVPLLTYDIK